MFNLTSFHPGGANVLACDGSVKFLKDSVGQSVIWALGSRAQGKILSADSYRAARQTHRPGGRDRPDGLAPVAAC
jgi:prepilin-type processing-associated H-X9-DG protein